jgi:hypothetical protein
VFDLYWLGWPVSNAGHRKFDIPINVAGVAARAIPMDGDEFLQSR